MCTLTHTHTASRSWFDAGARSVNLFQCSECIACAYKNGMFSQNEWIKKMHKQLKKVQDDRIERDGCKKEEEEDRKKSLAR